MRRLVWSWAALSVVLLASAPLRAETARGLAAQGNALYQAGKFADSLKRYQAAAAKAPDSPEILYDLGNARYRLNDLAGAAEAYQRAAILSRDPRLTGNSEFNLGDALFRQAEAEANNPEKAIKKYQESISHFRAAGAQAQGLRTAAGRNLEIGKRRLQQAEAELKKQRQAERQNQKERQELTKKLGQMADRQEKMAGRSQDLASQPPSPANQAAGQEEAGRQDKLTGQTREMAEQCKRAGKEGQAADQALKQAEQTQTQAGDELRAGKPGPAATAQGQAANSLRKAQEELNGQTPSPGRQENNQGPGLRAKEGQGEQAGQSGINPSPGGQTVPAASPNKNAKPPAGAAKAAVRSGEAPAVPEEQTAQDILAQEQKDRLNRQRQNRAGGVGYAPVGRDW
ncbi:MAG: tetratricopeptide repeat protein [Desulfobacteraceae bacterium]|nr:tetratricopeptide repeat protein [Desulfobacteraceae bacterium]